MKHLIDKDAVLAEIEKRIADNKKDIERASHKNLEDYFEGYHDALALLKQQFIDTIEVKDVELEKEIDKWWCSQFTDYSMVRVPNHKFVPKPEYIDSNFKQSEIGKTKIGFELCIDWKIDSNDIEWDPDTIRNFAKHFYELGLRAQKEE